MSRLEQRIKKLENQVFEKKHHGTFIIFIDNGIYTIISKEDKNKSFNNLIELKKYVYEKYNSDNYIFFTFDITNIKKD